MPVPREHPSRCPGDGHGPSKKRILVTGGAGFIGSHVVIHLVKHYPHYYIVNLDALDECSCLLNVHAAISSASCEEEEDVHVDDTQAFVHKNVPVPCTTERSQAKDTRSQRPGSKALGECKHECLSDAYLATLPTNYKFIHGNITHADLIAYILEREHIDTIVHFAAESHVDKSFGNAIEFTKTNLLGTHVLLEAARAHGIQRFIHVSTDEVYGEGSAASSEPMQEDHVLEPTNPYAATKAGAEFLVKSFHHSFRLPTIITRSNNVYGPHQYPEKVIPKLVNQILRHRRVTIHGDGSHTRTYLYISDVVAALDVILHKGVIGEVYNIGGTNERSNKQVALDLLALMKPELHATELTNLIEHVEDRPYNDHRYVIDSTKLCRLGWEERVSWQEGLRATVQWFYRFGHRFHDIDHALEAHPIKWKTTRQLE
ncbi:hypothetical protein PsorP6_015897 [Peronosclerospora sorghi]|uniref:Uncharacterized protein n=1 Tax=Peronosclerospora sorghi TaxID=230839 RepID=A0ACC0WN49_9STRA|nr:hypothetical protein PsorP6_015897 [Peronosclerospora sorghi]